MRVVVLGATGNIGTSLVATLAAEPAVTSLLGLARRLPTWRAEKTEWATCDIARHDLVEHFRGADAVVHLAWLFQPTHDPVLTWNTNVLGGIRVFEAAVAASVPTLVYASSVGAYSPGPKDRPVDETWPTDGWPTAGYTREKAYLERVLDTVERDHAHMRVVRLRPGFIFKQAAATEQRRLFAGPLLPHHLARPGLIPVLPDVPGLRFQALHSFDAADAFRLALLHPVRGAFNLAADPVVDVAELSRLLRATRVPLPASAVRAALSAAWRLHLVPASPQLFDAVLRLPIMDTERAREELGWQPRHSALDAISEFLEGLHTASGMHTPPLSPGTSGPARTHEFRTGIGKKP
ncbi:NAD-dependent epimerase/dehydratase family protein [Pseudonocardia nigra]|uniref:NAD-dependent epimerase/dehydratase family protein n=1 Tax=Pseudonocardia nigra TaxID=1921578 RepID=UPI001C5ED4F5|nr:NAD-dependent epimerase/dehydratase family protein [Pseudonocardia nigra]